MIASFPRSDPVKAQVAVRRAGVRSRRRRARLLVLPLVLGLLGVARAPVGASERNPEPRSALGHFGALLDSLQSMVDVSYHRTKDNKLRECAIDRPPWPANLGLTVKLLDYPKWILRAGGVALLAAFGTAAIYPEARASLSEGALAGMPLMALGLLGIQNFMAEAQRVAIVRRLRLNSAVRLNPGTIRWFNRVTNKPKRR